MQNNKKSVVLPKDDFSRALKLAEKFNLHSGARPNRRVKAALTQAIDFMHGIAHDVAKGAVISYGSAWTGPDLFLDKSVAIQTAREKSRTAYLTGNVDLTIAARDTAKLADIRKAFKLSSDKQAAALSIRVYDRMCDNLWRGNGFSMEDAQRQEKPLNTDAIKNRILRPKA